MQTKRQHSVPQMSFIEKNRLLWFLAFLTLSVFFLLTLDTSYNVWQLGEIPVRAGCWDLTAIFIASIGFILCKAGALYFSTQAVGVNIKFSAATKLLTQSVLIEITMFPSKIAGDTYKYFRLPTKRKKRKVMAVMVFRCTSFLPFLLFIVLYPKSILSWLFCATLLITVTWILCKKTTGHISWTLVFLSASGHFLALLIWAFQGYILLTVLSDSAPGFIYFVGIFLIAQVAAAASNLPFGLGIKEIFFGYTLSSFLGVEQLILFLILQRLSGELLTAFLGWLTLLPEIFKRKTMLKHKFITLSKKIA